MNVKSEVARVVAITRAALPTVEVLAAFEAEGRSFPAVYACHPIDIALDNVDWKVYEKHGTEIDALIRAELAGELRPPVQS